MFSRFVHDIAEIFSSHQLHRKVEKIFCFAYFVDRHDVRVRENRGRLRLLLKTFGCPLFENIFRQNFDRDLALKGALIGNEYNPHPATSQLLHNGTRADLPPQERIGIEIIY